jgi:hypothetical protein
MMLVLVVGVALVALAQQGTAPNGYYPHNYFGATFTGEVVDGPLDVLTLRYKKGTREELFTGRFEAPCPAPTKDGKRGAMLPADVPLGSTVTVFYYSVTTKTNGKSATENSIIHIRFDVVGGKIVPLEKRSRFNCTEQWKAVYKAFDAEGAVAVAPGPYQK